MSMHRLITIAIAGIAVFICTGRSMAASAADSVQASRLEVHADIDSAVVFLDTVRVGYTPVVLDGIPPGAHTLKVLPPHPEEWSVQAVTDTVHLLPGGSRVRSYQLRVFVPIRSDPASAELFINDSLAGVTPLLIKPSVIHPETRLTLKMKGFEPSSIPLSNLMGESALTVALKAGWQASPDESSPFIAERPPWNARRVGMFVSGGITVLAGVGAAYFKIAADSKQDAFMETGDPAPASERKRLDTLAGISLAFAQVGIMVLSYLLVTE